MHATVYAKTSKGRQEVEGRTFGLTAKERRILILVDAKRSANEIVTTAGLQCEVDALLARLHQDGFVQPVGHGAAIVTAKTRAIGTMMPRSNAPPEVVLHGTADENALGFAKQIMLKATHDHLGLLGADMARRIEAANSYEAIKSCLAKWNMAMRESLSGRAYVDEHLDEIQRLVN